ncbi:MAG: VOC family protein [Burkholderiaceae bacterium]|nr:VOC family protein [Burkholderiaceae bacterium]
MFSHIMVGSNDLELSKKFYDALFIAAGGTAGRCDSKGRITYVKDGRLFMVTKPIDGQAASFANGGTIGFSIPSSDVVDAWHAIGIANGGTSIENPPGIRDHEGTKIYLAYLRDPDGNKLCAIAPANAQ